MNTTLWPLYAFLDQLSLSSSTNGHRESCPCPRGCRWFRCGQPGPQEHVYKCEIFYATAGNYVANPQSIVVIKQRIAHVLGLTNQPPHEFGVCGRVWTIAALYYRLRDGPMSSSFALLLAPDPIPPPLLQAVTKLAKSEKPYQPRGHRLLDSNPFNGLGIGRAGVEKKEFLSHIAHAVWAAHACWTAKQCLGVTVDWTKWQFTHIAAPPAQLLSMRNITPRTEHRIKVSRSLNLAAMNKDLPSTHSAMSTPRGSSSGSATTDVDQPATPTLLHPRPQSFAGFARWEINTANGPVIRPIAPLPSSHSYPLQLSRNAPEPPARLLATSKRNSLVMLEKNGSTYYLANDSTNAAIVVDDDNDQLPLRRLSLAV